MFIWKVNVFLQENVLSCKEVLDDHYITKQSDTTQYARDNERSHDILSIIDEHCSRDLVEVSKYVTISPLKKPSMDIPTPPDKLLPRKLF